jgi:hypothetical protein
MIERERLQELINQGVTIYEVKYGKVNPVLLKNKIRFVSEKSPVIVFEPIPNEKYKHHKYFDKLYETQAEAEWVAKMHTQRTEFFEPPTWEEFEKQGEPYYFIGKGGIKERIYIYNNNGRRKLLSSGCKFWGTPTKDNYIKACEYARNLFLGKENENETDSDR